MTNEEIKNLKTQIEWAYILFATSIFEYYEGDKVTTQTVNDLLVKHIRPAINNFKKEIEDGK